MFWGFARWAGWVGGWLGGCEEADERGMLCDFKAWQGGWIVPADTGAMIWHPVSDAYEGLYLLPCSSWV